MDTTRAWYDVYGPAGAPVVVLVHGSVVTRVSWRPQVEALCDAYRLVVPDLPGHGVLAGEPFHLEEAALRIAALAEQECGPHGRAALVGMSLGGHVATLAAARMGQRAAGLVLSGASMNFTGLTGLWTRWVGRLMLRRNEDRLLAQAQGNIRKKWPRPAGEEIIAAGLYPRGAFESFLELSGGDFRAPLARVAAPVLILNGERDRPNRRGEAAFARAARDARVRVIAGAGHACSIEQPAAYTRAVKDFLETLSFDG